MINNTKKFLINFLQEKLILWSDDKSPESIKKLKELKKILKTEYKNIDIT